MIDWNKPIRTTCGKSVRVLCTDRKSKDGNAVLVLVDRGDFELLEFVREFVDGEGRVMSRGISYTFENVPEKRVVWINVYPTLDGDEYFHDVETADDWASEERIACVRVEYEIPAVEVNDD